MIMVFSTLMSERISQFEFVSPERTEMMAVGKVLRLPTDLKTVAFTFHDRSVWFELVFGIARQTVSWGEVKFPGFSQTRFGLSLKEGTFLKHAEHLLTIPIYNIKFTSDQRTMSSMDWRINFKDHQ